MGIMTRVLRLCKADVHGVMDQLEDKELLLKQYLREMEDSLDRKERQISALSQRQSGLIRQIDDHQGEMNRIENDLDLAIQKEKDDIARMLIRRRRTLESACRHLQTQMEMYAQEETTLTATLANHRLQYDTLKVKADVYCQKTRQSPFSAQTNPVSGEGCPIDPTQEEIELELIQRREALLKGGHP